MKKGYLYKRENKWGVAVPNSQCSSGYKRISGFRTKSKAREYLDQRKNQIENLQIDGNGKGDILFIAFFQDYLKYVKNSFSYETWKTYRGIMKDFLAFIKAQYPRLQNLNELVVKVFEDYKIWLKDTGHKDNTVNNHLKTFKAMFNVAEKWDYIHKNPIKNVSLVSVNDEKPIVTLNTPEKLNLFLERCKSLKPDYYPHYYCAIKLGLRFGEMATLEWQDINFTSNVLRITRKKTFNPKGRSRRDKKPKERMIPMSQDVIGVLKKLPHTNKTVFLKDKKPINVKDKSFRRWIIAIARGTELEGMTRFHELRHSTGDILGLSHGIYHIKKFLGHSDIRTTERYVRLPDEAIMKMAETLEKFGNTTQNTTQEKK